MINGNMRFIEQFKLKDDIFMLTKYRMLRSWLEINHRNIQYMVSTPYEINIQTITILAQHSDAFRLISEFMTANDAEKSQSDTYKSIYEIVGNVYVKISAEWVKIVKALQGQQDDTIAYKEYRQNIDDISKTLEDNVRKQLLQDVDSKIDDLLLNIKQEQQKQRGEKKEPKKGLKKPQEPEEQEDPQPKPKPKQPERVKFDETTPIGSAIKYLPSDTFYVRQRDVYIHIDDSDANDIILYIFKEYSNINEVILMNVVYQKEWNLNIFCTFENDSKNPVYITNQSVKEQLPGYHVFGTPTCVHVAHIDRFYYEYFTYEEFIEWFVVNGSEKSKDIKSY
jgi:hypothetical protein